MGVDRRRQGFAPLWVYLFGLFAVAAGQRLLFPPDQHSAATNVAVFTAASLIVVILLTVLERSKRR